MPWYFGNANFSQMHMMNWIGFGIIPLVLWSLAWKGVALWHAAKRGELSWFILLLIINTMGILEILYLLLIVRLFETKTIAPKNTPKKKKRK